MPKKSKGLLDAIDDLVFRRRKGAPLPKPEPIPTSRGKPQMQYLQKKQSYEPDIQYLQDKLNKVGTPKKVKRATTKDLQTKFNKVGKPKRVKRAKPDRR